MADGSEILFIVNTAIIVLIMIFILIGLYYSLKMVKLLTRWDIFFSAWNVNIRTDIV